MRALIAAGFVVAVLAGAATSPAAHLSLTKVCGQIKHGPNASYWSVVTGVRQKSGTTWTVFATRVPCTTALADSKVLFGAWKAAKLGGTLRLKGFACRKMIDRSYDGKGTSSGGGLCHRGSTPTTSLFDLDTFAFRMTGKYTVAQIRTLLHLG